MSELDDFRSEKNEFFRRSQQSPLMPEQQTDFEGLNYFAENPAMNLQLELEEFEEKQEIQMQTTTGSVQTYERHGQVQFSVDEETTTLTIYLNEHGYFLPFVDSLAGEQTYPAGRYLEPTPLGEGRIHIDFNYAYNPYCAYNEAWSCPITPAENRLKVPIEAGEKLFDQGNT